jgi:hypothetical protein
MILGMPRGRLYHRRMVEVSQGGRLRRAGVGGVVALWTFFDALVLGLPIMIVSAVSGRPLIVFLVGCGLYSTFNIGSCRWIERQWDDWIVGSSFGRRLEKLRAGKRAQRAIARITDGSAFAFGVAAVVLSASEVIALHRLATGRGAGRRRILAASFAPAVVYTALCTSIGWLVHQLLWG